jgi:hypothetical protein
MSENATYRLTLMPTWNERRAIHAKLIELRIAHKHVRGGMYQYFGTWTALVEVLRAADMDYHCIEEAKRIPG